MPIIIVGQVTVPDVTGQTLAAARASLAAVYLTDFTTTTRTFAYSANSVISQDPVGGTDVDADTSVALLLCSRGSRLVRVVRDSDVTRPNTPTGLAGVATSETQVSLSWNVATDPQGAPTEANSGVVAYQVFKDGAFRVGLPNNSVIVGGLTAYTVYAFQVLSVDGFGNTSVLSAPINVRTLDTTAPSIPTVTATSTGSTTLSIALTSPSTDSGSGL